MHFIYYVVKAFFHTMGFIFPESLIDKFGLMSQLKFK